MILLYQPLQNLRMWLPRVERFAGYDTVIAPHAPGFDHSDPLAGRPDIAGFARVMAEPTDAPGIERFALLGMHAGGLIGAIRVDCVQAGPSTRSALDMPSSTMPGTGVTAADTCCVRSGAEGLASALARGHVCAGSGVCFPAASSRSIASAMALLAALPRLANGQACVHA